MAETSEYRLTWSDCNDEPSLRAVVEHLRVFPLFKDSEAKLIDHKEYLKMVANKEIDVPRSYWKISKARVGLISLSRYSKYSQTWELIGSAKSDFQHGWKACEKHQA